MKKLTKALIEQQRDDALQEVAHYEETYPLRCAELEAANKRIVELVYWKQDAIGMFLKIDELHTLLETGEEDVGSSRVKNSIDMVLKLQAENAALHELVQGEQTTADSLNDEYTDIVEKPIVHTSNFLGINIDCVTCGQEYDAYLRSDNKYYCMRCWQVYNSQASPTRQRRIGVNNMSEPFKRFDELDEYRQIDLGTLRKNILKGLYILAGDINESPLVHSHKIMTLIRDSGIMDECYEGSYDAFKADQDDN